MRLEPSLEQSSKIRAAPVLQDINIDLLHFPIREKAAESGPNVEAGHHHSTGKLPP